MIGTLRKSTNSDNSQNRVFKFEYKHTVIRFSDCPRLQMHIKILFERAGETEGQFLIVMYSVLFKIRTQEVARSGSVWSKQTEPVFLKKWGGNGTLQSWKKIRKEK